MKKEYNRNTTSDIPLEASVSSTPTTPKKTTTPKAKPKINAIGKKATDTLKGKTAKNSTKSTKNPTKTTTKSTKSTTKSSTESDKTLKNNKQLEDLEKLNEENFKGFHNKSKRSKVVIVLLAFAIAIAIAVISVYVIIIRLDSNCRMIVHGADAVYIVDGEQLAEFRTPSNLQGNSRLNINIKLQINEIGEFNIKFRPEVFQNNVLIDNTLIYEPNTQLFVEAEDGWYRSRNPINGGQTINLCEGIIFDYYYKDSLNVDNFRMEFHTYLEKV